MSNLLVSAMIPRLHNGDHLDADEFIRRYEAMPEVYKAELIEGVVYIMSSPVRANEHALPQADLLLWLGNYRLYTPGVRAGDNATVRFDQDNVNQPDALLWVVHGGRSTIDSEGYFEGGPELVAEVAASSVSIDRNSKFRVYRDKGVCEYVLWRVEDEDLDWFILRDGEYVRLSPGEDGILRSEIFPGLWLDAAAMTRQDAPRVHEVLSQGIASPAHAEFVERMRQASV